MRCRVSSTTINTHFLLLNTFHRSEVRPLSRHASCLNDAIHAVEYYHTVQRLGAGAFGAAWLVEDARDNQMCVLL